MLRSVLNLFLVCSPDLHLAATFDQEHATQKHMQVQVSADGSLASALQVMRRQKDGLALKGVAGSRESWQLDRSGDKGSRFCQSDCATCKSKYDEASD
ncbi:unnamed protein product [Effrenium voratum]|nr:unnamed protein product [Effrenium voratum]